MNRFFTAKRMGLILLLTIISLLAAACSGDNGAPGPAGSQGAQGSAGAAGDQQRLGAVAPTKQKSRRRVSHVTGL